MKNKTNKWILWTILVIGVWIVAGCGSDGPTSPDPSDVQDFGYGDGGLPINADSEACLTAYDILVASGGGATQVINDSDYSLIGIYDRWSGVELDNGRILIRETGNQDVMEFQLNGKILLTELAYPITVTVYRENYIAETLVLTNANIHAFALTHQNPEYNPALVIGYTFDQGPSDQNWIIAATGSHLKGWEISSGDGGINPYTQFLVDSNRPVSAAAFMFEYAAGSTPSQDFSPIDLTECEALGYSYSPIGTLEPGAVGGWIMNLNETGPGTDRGTGNLTISHTPVGEEINRISLTPGGMINESEEFVPYFFDEMIETALGIETYAINSYDPPAIFDRHVIHAVVHYSDGTTAERFVPWNIGSGLPDIDFGPVPIIDEQLPTIDVPLETDDPYEGMYEACFNASWTNDEVPGYLCVTMTNSYEETLWHIRLASDATELPLDHLMYPTENMIYSSVTRFKDVSRIECAGFDIDDFTNAAIYINTSATATSNRTYADLYTIPY